MADHGLYCSIIIQLVPYSCYTLILIIHTCNLSRCRLWRGGWEIYTQYHDSSPIQSPTNCIKSHNDTYMCTYIFRFLVGRYNVCDRVHCPLLVQEIQGSRGGISLIYSPIRFYKSKWIIYGCCFIWRMFVCFINYVYIYIEASRRKRFPLRK